jgi:hypothetical protein
MDTRLRGYDNNNDDDKQNEYPLEFIPECLYRGRVWQTDGDDLRDDDLRKWVKDAAPCAKVLMYSLSKNV